MNNEALTEMERCKLVKDSVLSIVRAYDSPDPLRDGVSEETVVKSLAADFSQHDIMSAIDSLTFSRRVIRVKRRDILILVIPTKEQKK